MSQYNIVYLCIDKINKDMTLQQLEYIIAVEQHGYFVTAADACGVTQSTLSLMIKKLEDELDVKIFNRDTHPVTVTEMGRKVIDEAKMAVYHTKQLLELTRTAKEQASGDLSIAMTTTVAPVLMPGLFRYMRTKNSAIRLRVEEMITTTIILIQVDGELLKVLGFVLIVFHSFTFFVSMEIPRNKYTRRNFATNCRKMMCGC